MDSEKYFEMLISWKQLPAYRMEPRIDSMIGYYLPLIFEKKIGKNIIGVIPEFPLRKGTIDPDLENPKSANFSNKVDFYAISESGENYFVEIKSDSNSIRPDQDNYLNMALKIGMKEILESILKLSEASKSKIKYDYLLEQLNKFGLLNNKMGVICKNNEIELVYILPKKSDNDAIIDFRTIANLISKEYKGNQFALDFSDALIKWSED